MVAPLLPVLQHDLGTTQYTDTQVLTAYLLSASVATPILGRFGDTFGKKDPCGWRSRTTGRSSWSSAPP
jgi:MFS family permease